jgi:hypothetical protein
VDKDIADAGKGFHDLLHRAGGEHKHLTIFINNAVQHGILPSEYAQFTVELPGTAGANE